MQKTTNSFIIFLVLFFSNISLQAQIPELMAEQIIKENSSSIHEHILTFHSDIKIDTTGRVDVTETIWVLATGESIKRGIVRTIPVYRKDIHNLERRIDIQVDSVFKNGEAEKFATKVENRDFAIYIGNEDVTLSPNIYEYTVKYWSRGHVGFFDSYDELYWNVNGNEWAFDIDSISATVYLPTGSRFINSACYTGLEGSTAKDCSYRSIGDTIVEFYSNTAFKQNEGLTIAAAFTPNIIKRPPPPTAFEAFMESNGFGATFTLISLIFIIFSAIALVVINTMNGRAISIPLFNSPLGKSATNLRYLFKKEADNKAFMVCLLSMAVKKAILIKNSDKDFTLTSLGYTDELSSEELEVYLELFGAANMDIILSKKKSPSIVGQAFDNLRDLLAKNSILTNYYLPKNPYIDKFILISIIFFILWLAVVVAIFDISFADIFISLFSVVVLPIMLTLSYIKRKSWFTCICFIFLTISALSMQIPFYVQNPFYKYSIIFSWILTIVNIIFIRYVKPLTKQGLKFETELEGFKMYLSVAEENRLNMLTPPDMTPEQFEKMLPYAVALDLEIKWAKKFERYLPSNNYQPSWYLGSNSGTYVDFTSTMTKTFAYSIKRSIPRSSTTSSGGGFLGGGFTSGRSSSGSRSSSSGSRSFSSGSSGRGSSGRGGGGGGGRGW